MPFLPGQSVIHETHVAGFATRAAATVREVKGKQVFADNIGGTPLGAGVFNESDGWQVEHSTGARSRIVSVPAQPQDLWGDRSAWFSVDKPPVREGWYEFRQAVDGAVHLTYFIDGSWLAGESIETLAPLILAGGEQWQGLAEDPVQAQEEAAEAAADEAEVLDAGNAEPAVAEPADR